MCVGCSDFNGVLIWDLVVGSASYVSRDGLDEDPSASSLLGEAALLVFFLFNAMDFPRTGMALKLSGLT